MREDRYDTLERYEPLFEAPTFSAETFHRARERTRRRQRVASATVALAVFLIPVALFVASGVRPDRGPTPGVNGPSWSVSIPPPPPPFASKRVRQQRLAVLAQLALASLDGKTRSEPDVPDRINDCDLLLVTAEGVEEALGFHVERVRAWEPVGVLPFTPEEIQGMSGVEFGCEYLSGSSLWWDGVESLVISAYSTEEPPRTDPRAVPFPPFAVPGIGHDATFTFIANGDGHADGPDGGSSMLQVRIGDLILRFNASSRFDATDGGSDRG